MELYIRSHPGHANRVATSWSVFSFYRSSMKSLLIRFFGDIVDPNSLEEVLEAHASDCEHEVSYDYKREEWYCEKCSEEDEEVLVSWYTKDERQFEY